MLPTADPDADIAGRIADDPEQTVTRKSGHAEKEASLALETPDRRLPMKLGYLVLGRDTASRLIMVIGIAVAASGLCRGLARRNVAPRKRIAISGGLVFVISAIAPVVGLLIHCTSGDCL
jgi:hypothetical protein